MKTILLMSTFLLTGCLFVGGDDGDNNDLQDCQATQTCKAKVQGKFEDQFKECFASTQDGVGAIPDVCPDGGCTGPESCRYDVTISLTNTGSEPVDVTPPESANLYDDNKISQATVTLDAMILEDEDVDRPQTEKAIIKRVLELQGNSTVKLTFSFLSPATIQASEVRAHFDFEIEAQEPLTILSNPIVPDGFPLEPQPEPTND